jgi:putative ABC transport system permease protein
LVLLAGAGLLIRSFCHLLQVNPGFRPEGVIAVGIDPGGQKYGWLISPDRGRRLVRFFDEVRGNVAAIPGVQAVALSDSLPLDRAASS